MTSRLAGSMQKIQLIQASVKVLQPFHCSEVIQPRPITLCRWDKRPVTLLRLWTSPNKEGLQISNSMIKTEV